MFLHDSQIHNDRTHTDQYLVLYRASMNNRIMPDRYIISNDGLRLFKRTVDHCTILYIHPVTNANSIDVSPYHSTPPNRTIIAHAHITDDDSSFCKETITSHGWCVIINGANNSHLFLL